MTASVTPTSELRRLNARSPNSMRNWFRKMNSGMIVATDGSIRTPRTAIIRVARPRNLSRENA